MEMILAPSILAADFTKLGEQMKETEREGAQYIHFDVMDGKFCAKYFFWNAGTGIHQKRSGSDF